MGIEIERKFFVHKEQWQLIEKPMGQDIVQGYICVANDRSVRVRLSGPEAFLTIKGETSGMSRMEFEYPVPPADARQLLDLLCGRLISKVRYNIPHAGHVWEVDVFSGVNEGLIIAEVELQQESEQVALPDWIGKEVTGDARYYNATLAVHPFTEW